MAHITGAMGQLWNSSTDAPTCTSNQSIIYGAAKQEDVKIKCTVDANPYEVEFTWTFNNSAESIDVATNHISQIGTTSIVTYTPVTELDYGTLLCSATNKIGRQRIPCVFHIIAAGRPDHVHNCTLSNISMTSLTVTCSDGFDGGLSQLFVMELVDAHLKELKANITSAMPKFTVSALSPGGIYILTLYAFNSKGRSEPTILTASMLGMPEKQLIAEPGTRSESDFFVAPIISLTLGLTVTILITGLGVIFALRIPFRKRDRHQKDYCNDHTQRSMTPEISEKSSEEKDIDANDDDKNPDVIPESINTDMQHSILYENSISQCTLPRGHHPWTHYNCLLPTTTSINPSELNQQILLTTNNFAPRFLSEPFTSSAISPAPSSLISPLFHSLKYENVPAKESMRVSVPDEVSHSKLLTLHATNISDDTIAIQTPLLIKGSNSA